MTSGDIRTGEPVDFGPPDEQVLTEIEESILIDPRILAAGLSMLAVRYATLSTEDGEYVTPDTTIRPVQGEDAEATVFVGSDTRDNYRKVVYQKDSSTGETREWIVFSGFPLATISDGSGRPLESDHDRRHVRAVIDAMRDNYEKDVRATAESFDINCISPDYLMKISLLVKVD